MAFFLVQFNYTMSRYNVGFFKMPQILPIYSDTIVREKLVDTFKKCIGVFDPFWGCLGNNINIDRYNGYGSNSLPTTTYWVNYFGKNICTQIGTENIEQAPVENIQKFCGI